MISNPMLHTRTNHVILDIHFVCEKIMISLITVHHIPSVEKIADILTKPLSHSQFFFFVASSVL